MFLQNKRFKINELTNWKSGNEKIDNFIQEMQLKIKDHKDVIFEWIPYNHFNKIEKTGGNDFMTIYSAIWKDGLLHLGKQNNYYTRSSSNKKIALKCLHNSENFIECVINEAKKYSIDSRKFLVLYGISKNPYTNDYILVQNNSLNFTNWESGNEKIDEFIHERQLEIRNYNDIVFEWIPCNHFNEIEKTDGNDFMTIYSAIWKDGPLYWNNQDNNYTRVSPNKEVALKCLHYSQNFVESVINEAKKYSIDSTKFLVLYGITKNPYTNDYILCFNWTSGNEKIDEFIQERQLKIKNNNDVVFEWIPYNHFNKIEEIDRNDYTTIYSAMWKDGPLHWSKRGNNCIRYSPNEEVALKCLHNSQNYIESVINEAKNYSINSMEFLVLYGISKNPHTNDYILVLNFTNWTSGNERIDGFIQEMQLKIKDYNDVVFEWIPYNHFNKIEKTGGNDLMTIYSAIWKDGPFYWDKKNNNYTRNSSNKEVALKCLDNSQNSIESVINEAKRYSIDSKSFLVLYGISKNPYTNDYILVQNNYILMSGNEKIDEFIQEMQLKIKNYNDVVFEWIPYNHFDKIEEIGRNDFMTTYSAIWKDGPFYWDKQNNNYTRNSSNKEVALKCLHNSQNFIESVINESNKYSTKSDAFLVLHGISKNPYTNDYILVFNWASGNEKIDEFIQERQLKIKNYNDVVFEWIPYNHFNKIEEIGRNDFMTIYSAIWKDGPLRKMGMRSIMYYIRESNKEVALKCLHNSQNFIDSVINGAKKYSIDSKSFLVLYGISKNPFTNDYILVQNNYTLTSGNEKIDEFIQERQLKIKNYNDVAFEWIPYNHFNKIEEIGRNDFMTTYSAIWKDGPLQWNKRDNNCTRYSPNKEVALKCFHNSQNFIESVINEAKRYSLDSKSFLVLYGISKNPCTNDYIFVQNNSLNFTIWASGNGKIDEFIQEMQLKIKDHDDVVFEWIPYNHFNKIEKTGGNDFMTIYSAMWKDGPLHWKKWSNKFIRYSPNKKVALRCLHNSQKFIESVINEARIYSTNNIDEDENCFKLYGMSRNLDTNDYILVQSNYINFINWMSENEKIDDFIQKMQLKFNSRTDVLFEWIPYDQFNEIKEIGKGGFATVYSAIWKDGPLHWHENERRSNKKVALKRINNSQNLINELLNEVKEYTTEVVRNSSILKIYGISQDPVTKNYIIVLHYAAGGSFDSWININENYKYFDWKKKMRALYNIASGLKEIHEKKMIHRDFHTGNILFGSLFTEDMSKIYISDMGLCGEVGNVDKTQIYGVLPYVAPEVLRRKPYNQTADIYSFGMIMYFVATGRQPFDNCAHNHHLALDICRGIRPEINEEEAPKSYFDLMRKCWNSNSENRPNITELYDSLWSIIINNSEIEKAENYRNLYHSEGRQINTHPQAIYISRLLNPFTEDLPKYDYNSECSDCIITTNLN
ncbi:hypothetical protein RclHR1_00960001 [Rhizophagus clarus]|uniref:Protein kinase domain-containing protein n=1 Tax=Rhizophagus clarus TaxID=94130 RepID=A0A2Z6S4W8_9GLOM|nr:hypothetical protein RclHR1_00960001 [Rhizophagus clarus]